MWQAIAQWWNAQSPQVQAAIVSGLFTAVTAAVGVAIVVVQLRGQARNAVRSNRHSEAIKLKKNVYEEVLPEIKEAENARLLLSSYVLNFMTEVTTAEVFISQGYNPVPKARVGKVLDLHLSFSTKFIGLMGIVDRWRIIDLRLNVFRVAISAVKLDVEAVHSAYFNRAIGVMPHGDEVKNWLPPTGPDLEKFVDISDAYYTVLKGAAAIIVDFQIEMQNLLLGEMFKTKLPARGPVSSRYRAVELDKQEELERYYSEKGKWGNAALPWFPRPREPIPG